MRQEIRVCDMSSRETMVIVELSGNSDRYTEPGKIINALSWYNSNFCFMEAILIISENL